MRADMVCEISLAKVAAEIHLGSHMLLGHGEEQGGGRNRASILADAVESVIAAIFLDGGMEPAKAFILKYVVPTLDNHRKAAFKDYKTLLQEVIQQNPEDRLTYLLVEESGPDHDKVFKYEVHINSNPVGTGTGRSKKEAEQAAAKEALRLMGIDHGQKG
jgi:ribonuclease-3